MWYRKIQSKIVDGDWLWTSDAAHITYFFHNKVMFPFKIMLVYDEPAYPGANNIQLSSYYISVPDFPELLAL